MPKLAIVTRYKIFARCGRWITTRTFCCEAPDRKRLRRESIGTTIPTCWATVRKRTCWATARKRKHRPLLKLMTATVRIRKHHRRLKIIPIHPPPNECESTRPSKTTILLYKVVNPSYPILSIYCTKYSTTGWHAAIILQVAR